MTKFLIDNCLTPALAKLARDRGHEDATHLEWRHRSDWKDWNVTDMAIDGDWTLVTRNSVDFRGPAKAPGTNGEYSKRVLHAGLICLNGPSGMDLDMQIDLFRTALDALAKNEDLVNQCLEVTMDETGAVRILRYELPKGEETAI
ncbi:MAG TPA: DUF5615 family PIN-like protein [Allosphingosinicella sp.]|jgi:hypothetical protein